jgi:hypothetical protein
MSAASTDDPRLRATEEQMRRALGLPDDPSPAPRDAQPVLAGAARPHRHRFVRDGEVPVTVVRRDHDDGGGINRVDAARQALREQVAAREQAERLLQEARTAIQMLETKLAHGRIGMDETLRRLEDELAAERTARQGAEEHRNKAIADRQDAEQRLRKAMAGQEVAGLGLNRNGGSRHTARRDTKKGGAAASFG